MQLNIIVVNYKYYNWFGNEQQCIKIIYNFINKEKKNMAKRIIAVMLVFIMILSTSEITASAASYATGMYSTSTIINFRTGPGLNYSKIGMTANGATFQVTKVNGSWGYSSNIQTVGGETKAGWVNLKYCKQITASTASYATGTYSTSTVINIRTGGGLNYSVLGMTANGATFQVIKVNGSWGYSSNIQTVRGETKAGWVNLKYCKQIDSVRTTYNDVFASIRGKGYSLFQAKALESTSFPKGSFVYVWGFVHDAQNNFYMSYSSGKTCNMTLSVYRPNGSCVGTYTYNGSDNNWIGLKLDEVGTWKIQSKITGSITGTNTRTITVTESSTTSSDLGKSLLQEKFAKSVYDIATKQEGKNYSVCTSKGSDGEVPEWCGYYVKWVLKNAYEQIGYNYQDFVPVSNLISASKTGASYQAGGYGECYSFTSWKKVSTNREGFISDNLQNCTPKVGDIILVETEYDGNEKEKLLNGPDHLGIIIKVNADGSFISSEGNTGNKDNTISKVKQFTYVKSNSGLWHREGDSLRTVHMICSVKLPN